MSDIASGNCKGDTTFSSFFVNSAADVDCFCNAKTESEVQNWKVGGTFKAFKCWGWLEATFRVASDEPARRALMHPPELTCVASGLHVDSQGELWSSIRAV